MPRGAGPDGRRVACRRGYATSLGIVRAPGGRLCNELALDANAGGLPLPPGGRHAGRAGRAIEVGDGQAQDSQQFHSRGEPKRATRESAGRWVPSIAVAGVPQHRRGSHQGDTRLSPPAVALPCSRRMARVCRARRSVCTAPWCGVSGAAIARDTAPSSGVSGEPAHLPPSRRDRRISPRRFPSCSRNRHP